MKILFLVKNQKRKFQCSGLKFEKHGKSLAGAQAGGPGGGSPPEGRKNLKNLKKKYVKNVKS